LEPEEPGTNSALKMLCTWPEYTLPRHGKPDPALHTQTHKSSLPLRSSDASSFHDTELTHLPRHQTKEGAHFQDQSSLPTVEDIVSMETRNRAQRSHVCGWHAPAVLLQGLHQSEAAHEARVAHVWPRPAASVRRSTSCSAAGLPAGDVAEDVAAGTHPHGTPRLDGGGGSGGSSGVNADGLRNSDAARGRHRIGVARVASRQLPSLWFFTRLCVVVYMCYSMRPWHTRLLLTRPSCNVRQCVRSAASHEPGTGPAL